MTLRVGLIGDPVSHSHSPPIFSTLARLLGRRIVYKTYRVRGVDLSWSLEDLRRRGLKGLNVTIPHKVAVVSELRALSREARLAGAVNAVRFSGRAARGHNTDAAGFADALKETGFKAAGKDAVVFGCGGAARAVGTALASLKARRVRFTARDSAKAKRVARLLSRGSRTTRFEAGARKRAALWVNATPLGMKGFPAEAPFKGKAACTLAFDLVYGRRTPFLRRARAAGARTLDGKSMLVFQALRSYEFWSRPLGEARRRRLKNDIIERIP